MIIALIGYMGSGKTTIGKDLAESLGYSFVDLDESIAAKEGKSIVEIFKQQGEIRFRKIERTILLELLDTHQNTVIALGGGTPAYYDNMDCIQKSATSVYLRLSPKELFERLAPEKTQRPLIAHLANEDLTEFIAKHLFERRAFYEKANFTIAVQQKNVEEIVQEINLFLRST